MGLLVVTSQTETLCYFMLIEKEQKNYIEDLLEKTSYLFKGITSGDYFRGFFRDLEFCNKDFDSEFRIPFHNFMLFTCASYFFIFRFWKNLKIILNYYIDK